ncbi:hypothetical protein BMS3Abin01_00757 [bacterium BMS3Abin01]|nr:hypothetical protein BMS3Abin01_00757 [bacterium BMS3Abin01]
MGQDSRNRQAPAAGDAPGPPSDWSRLLIIGGVIAVFILAGLLLLLTRALGGDQPAPRVTTETAVAYSRPATISSTTSGSDRVDMSPRSSTSPAATFRRMRLMILPLRVLGRPWVNWTLSGLAMGPISCCT